MAAPTPPRATELTVVPDRRTVRLLVVLSFALLATSIAVMAVADGADAEGGTTAGRTAGAVGLLAVVAFIVSLALLGALLTRSGVRELRSDGRTLTIVGGDGTEQVIPVVEVGYIGTSGRRTLGAVVPGMRHGAWLVVSDRRQGVLAVRRSTGLRPEDLSALAVHLAVPWLDELVVIGTYVPPRPAPIGLDDAPRADDDPRIWAPFERLRTRRRRRLLAYVATFALGVASAVLAGRVGDVAVLGPLLVATAVAGCTVGFFLLLLAPLNADRIGGIRRALRGATFELVQGAVVDLRGDRRPRVVGTFAPTATMPTTWWVVEQGGEHGWLEGLQSGWYWHGTRPGSVRSVLLPADCSQVALLSARRRDLPVRSAVDRQFRASREIEPSERAEA